MNISFRNLNETIHPYVESIPEYTCHYTSAVFVNADFWNDDTKIMDGLKLEANCTYYIQLYMSFINMQRTTYNLVTRGKFLISITLIHHLFIDTTIKTTH